MSGLTVNQVLEQSQKAAENGDRQAAHNGYVAILTQFPKAKAAADGLRAMGASVPSLLSADDQARIDKAKAMAGRGQMAAAVQDLRDMAAARPLSAAVLSALAGLLHRSGQSQNAARRAQQAVELDPKDSAAWAVLGQVRMAQSDAAGAEAAFRAAVKAAPKDSLALNNLGVFLMKQRRYHDAYAQFVAATKAAPKDANAYNGIAVIYLELTDYPKSIAMARRALALRPDLFAALHNLASALMCDKQYAEAAACYEKCLMQRPRDLEIRSKLLLTYARICDWDGVARHKPIFVEELRRAGPALTPPSTWALLGIFDDPEIHYLATRKMVGEGPHSLPDLGEPAQRKRPKKLRVGYFAADYHDHPSAHLIVELFEQHDHDKFEIHAFSFGPEDSPEMLERIRAGVDGFHSVGKMRDIEIAELARAEKIDIAIDVNGHTAGKRPGIFKYRAAPVQASFLGYCGTMGMDCYDYIVADETVIPTENLPYFTEKPANMPFTYQVNDRKKKVSDDTPTRAEAGLPDEGLVFCCFNNSFKITAEVFAVWMKLLADVPGSVLWLFETQVDLNANLRQAAQDHGIDPDRLIFAPRVSHADHFARHRLADIFLDTLPCNAHTTASDALWMSVPVITIEGKSWAGRVAAGLLRAADLPELITHDLDSYAALARELALDPARLAALKAKMQATVRETALFDTAMFARQIEDLYRQMHSLAAAGKAPEPLTVRPSAR